MAYPRDRAKWPLGEPLSKAPQPPAAPKPISLQERFGKVLNIGTSKPARASGSEDSKDYSSPQKPLRLIRTVTNFSSLYEIGGEVMPSGHQHMSVNHGVRLQDGLAVVIKVRLKPHCFKSSTEEGSWRRSTQYLLNMKQSDSIARIYEVLEDKKALYVIMEKVNGMDLFETLAQQRPSVAHAREIIEQLLEAMAHFHANSAVHKDLKLENIMIDSTDTSPRRNSRRTSNSNMLSPKVKVIDFDTVDEWTPHSPTGKEVVGTDQYIAQEAYAGRYSPLSDVFAVGVIAYRLLCGKCPFLADLFDDEPGENWVGSPKMEEIRQKLKTTEVDFSHKVFKANPLAADLVQRMLSHSEKMRPSAGKALQHAWFSDDVSPAMSFGASVGTASLTSGHWPGSPTLARVKKPRSPDSPGAPTWKSEEDDEICPMRSRSALPGSADDEKNPHAGKI